MDGVLELLLQHLLARVPGQLEQEEAGVGLWQEVIRRVVLVQHLGDRGKGGRQKGKKERKEGRGEGGERKEGARKGVKGEDGRKEKEREK